MLFSVEARLPIAENLRAFGPGFNPLPFAWATTPLPAKSFHPFSIFQDYVNPRSCPFSSENGTFGTKTKCSLL